MHFDTTQNNDKQEKHEKPVRENMKKNLFKMLSTAAVLTPKIPINAIKSRLVIKCQK